MIKSPHCRVMTCKERRLSIALFCYDHSRMWRMFERVSRKMGKDIGYRDWAVSMERVP